MLGKHPKGDLTGRLGSGQFFYTEQETEFSCLMKTLAEHSLLGTNPDIHVVYDGLNIWAAMSGKTLLDLGLKRGPYKTNTYDKFGDGKLHRVRGKASHEKMITSSTHRFHDIGSMPTPMQFQLIQKTFWFKRLKPKVQNRLKYLIVVRDKLLEVKEMMNTVDAIVASLLLVFPDAEWNYKLSDRIQTCIFSNLVLDPSWIISWKKIKKQLRKHLLNPGSTRPEIPRSMSFLSYFIRSFPHRVDPNTRIGAFGIMSLCQTRNTGIADYSGIDNSLNKFKRTVSIPSDPIIGEYPSTFIRPYLKEVVSDSYFERCKGSAHVSLALTACYERNVANGGKLGVALPIVNFYAARQLGPQLIDLETGLAVDGVYVDHQQVGEVLFYDALWQFKSKYNDMMTANIAVIREAGPKWRTVTSSSFYHATLLHPWSHLMLEILKCVPECKSGISKSRHGWNFASNLDISNEATSWIFDYINEVKGLSTDLEEATDYFNRFVIKDLVNLMNELFKIPRWYAQVVLILLCDPRKITTSRHPFAEAFVEETCRAAFMGDPGTKVLLTLLGLAVTLSTRQKYVRFYAENIGDDYAAIGSDDSCRFALTEFQRFGMKISEDDTFISDRYIFYTEELIRIPTSVDETISCVTHSRNWGLSPYIDGVKGRFLIDATKNRDDYASCPEGRISGLGKDISYLSVGSDPVCMFHLASFLQDIYLNLVDYRGLVYFPQEVLGQGKPPLWDVPTNPLTFWSIQWGGRFAKNYARAVVEAIKYVNDDGINVERSICISYANTGMFRHSTNIPWRCNLRPVEDPKFLQFQVAQVPRYNSLTSYIMPRLSKFIISESEISGRLMKQEHMLSLIYGTEIVYKEANLVNIPPLPIVGVEETRQFTIGLEYFLELWLRSPQSLNSTRSERYFYRPPVEAILGKDYPLTVSIVTPKQVPVSNEIGRTQLERDSHELFNWLSDSWEKEQRGERITDIPRRLLDDDPFLMSDCDYEGFFTERFRDVFIITNDAKLAERIAYRRRCVAPYLRTYRIPIRNWVYTQCSYHHWKPEMTWNNYVVDLGSLDAFAASYFGGHIPYSYLVPEDFVGINPSGKMKPKDPFPLRSDIRKRTKSGLEIPKFPILYAKYRTFELGHIPPGTKDKNRFDFPPFAKLRIIPKDFPACYLVRVTKFSYKDLTNESKQCDLFSGQPYTDQ